MANRTVEAILRLSSKLGSMRAFRTLAGNLDRVDRKARDFNRRQSMIATGARNMNAMLLRYAGPAVLAYGAKEAITEYAALERQMTRIGITAGANAEDTVAALQKVQNMAKEFAMPLSEVIAGLDTLVASGMDLEQALNFLPSVVATAQAAGAATEDIANTAQKTSSALKMEAAEMQRAFDIMVEGGKAGQFELKDMAAYIPELANSFASLGYEGEDGLKKLVAILQTIREDTGSASAAATQAQNIFGKMYTEETATKFKKLGVNLRKELKAAAASGEDVLQAFVRISNEAINGDLSKLPLLFTDQEFRLGMQSLMTSADSYKKFIDTVNSSEVDGTVMRDLGRVLEDNQAKIDRMAESWDRLKQTAGSAIAGPAGTAMDYVSGSVDYAAAVNRGLESKGISGFLERSRWGITHGREAKDGMAWRGGYRTEEQQRMIAAYGDYGRSRAKAPVDPVIPVLEKDRFGLPKAGPIPRFRDGGGAAVAESAEPIIVPTPRPSDEVRARDSFNREFESYQSANASRFRPMPDDSERSSGGGQDGSSQLTTYMNVLEAAERRLAQRSDAITAPVGKGIVADAPPAASASHRDAERQSTAALRSDPNGVADAIDTALAEGGERAGKSIETAARQINAEAESAGSTFRNMLAGMGEQLGADIARSLKANLGQLTVNARVSGASVNPGRTAPAAGGTGAQ